MAVDTTARRVAITTADPDTVPTEDFLAGISGKDENAGCDCGRRRHFDTGR